MADANRRSNTARIRRVGRLVNGVIVRAPWAWPLLRRPVQRYFAGRAPGWDQRTGAGSPDHLAALASAALHAGEPERVLDVGTGTGEGALMLAREFPRASVRGVDISDEMIRAAQGKVGLDPEGRVAFRVADAAALPFGDESFDLVAMLNMPPFFAETARVLRPGGYVIVASSWGDATPFFTPDAVLERGFGRHGIEAGTTGEVEQGTYFVGHKPLTG